MNSTTRVPAPPCGPLAETESPRFPDAHGPQRPRHFATGPTYPFRMARNLAEERYRQLRTVGRVEIPQSMGHFVFALLGALAFTAIGAGFIYAAFTYSPDWADRLVHPGTWIGLPCIGFFGVVGIPALILQMFRSSTLTLTWSGIEEHTVKKGERVLTATTAWSDIEAISGNLVGGWWPAKGQYLVFIHLRPEAHGNYRDAMHPAMRPVESLNSPMFGRGSVALRRYAGGPKVMHELLDRALRDFGAPGPGAGHGWGGAHGPGGGHGWGGAHGPGGEHGF